MLLTRQQAKENQLELCDSCLVDEALELIDLIYDSVEAQVCESCKCKSNPSHVHGYLCENKKSVAYQCYVSSDGGCNKWEQK